MRVSEKAVVVLSVPATAAIAPELSIVIELILATADAGLVIVAVVAVTVVSTPAR